jgi:hypothetical protein
MEKYILTIIVYTLTSTVFAQNVNPQDDLREIQKIKLTTLNELAIPQHFQVSVPNLKLQIPEQYSESERENILTLMSKLKQTCPDCSTGGTIGGGTITGGNTGGSSTPLFPVTFNNPITLISKVTITLIEYNKLKKKAALYDDIMLNNGENQ